MVRPADIGSGRLSAASRAEYVLKFRDARLRAEAVGVGERQEGAVSERGRIPCEPDEAN